MNESTIITRAEKPNSFEFGKAGNRFKLYFDSATDLQQQIKALKTYDLIEEPEEIELK